MIYGKKSKFGKGNLYLSKIWLSRNKMWCAAGNRNFMCERIFNLNFNYAVIDKISNLREIVPNFTNLQIS